MVRVATWNVNSLKARLGRLEEWLAEVGPDVVCLQETKLADAAFPAMAFAALGYESAHHGEGRWNGVAILSRVGLEDVRPGFCNGRVVGPEGAEDAEARLLSARCGGVRVASLYVPNGRAVGSEHFRFKLDWLAQLRRHLDESCDPGGDVLLCGDFNIAPEDRDVWDVAEVANGTHVTPPERAALAELTSWGLVDVLRARHQEPRLYTWWDYRAGMFHKHMGMRIDLMLASKPLADRLEWVLVDRNARKGKAPSDHAPMVAEFA